MLRQVPQIRIGKWLFQEMNVPDPLRFFRRRSEGRSRQKYGLRLRMAGPQLAQENVPLPTRCPNHLCFLANEKHFLFQLALANDWIASSQFAPAGFAALIYRDRFHKINAARHLPTAQPRPAMREQFSLAQTLRYHTRGDFFIPALRFAAENDRRSHSIAAQHFGFYFRRMHFLARNVDQVRAASNDPVAAPGFFQQIIRDKNATTQSFFIRLREVASSDRPTSHSNERDRISGIDLFNHNSGHRHANKSRNRLYFADITNPTALRCTVKRVDLAAEFSAKGLRCFRRQGGSGRNAKP